MIREEIAIEDVISTKDAEQKFAGFVKRPPWYEDGFCRPPILNEGGPDYSPGFHELDCALRYSNDPSWDQCSCGDRSGHG